MMNLTKKIFKIIVLLAFFSRPIYGENIIYKVLHCRDEHKNLMRVEVRPSGEVIVLLRVNEKGFSKVGPSAFVRKFDKVDVEKILKFEVGFDTPKQQIWATGILYSGSSGVDLNYLNENSMIAWKEFLLELPSNKENLSLKKKILSDFSGKAPPPQK